MEKSFIAHPGVCPLLLALSVVIGAGQPLQYGEGQGE